MFLITCSWSLKLIVNPLEVSIGRLELEDELFAVFNNSTSLSVLYRLTMKLPLLASCSGSYTSYWLFDQSLADGSRYRMVLFSQAVANFLASLSFRG
jgi:hypothetical protein